MKYFSIDKFLNDDMSHMKHEHEECGKKIVKKCATYIFHQMITHGQETKQTTMSKSRNQVHKDLTMNESLILQEQL
jgi:hypothetical protein